MNTEKKARVKTPAPVAVEESTEQRLYRVLGNFSDNLMVRQKTSTELFRDEYGDPTGNVYWRGWRDMPVLNVVSFAKLLAVHKANEYDDNHGAGKELSVRLDEEAHGFHVSIPGPMLLVKFLPEQDKVLFALHSAAKNRASFFRGDCTLLANMTEDDIANGWKVEYGPQPAEFHTRYLTEVELNPREALEWFIVTSPYTDLLPESLQAWWAARSVQGDQTNREAPQKTFTHSSDYRSIYKDGRTFFLTEKQAQVIKLLWEAQENKTPELAQDSIMVLVSPNTTTRLIDLFKDDDAGKAAWNALIERGHTRNAVRLKG
jgi:hypothetical protein